MSTVQSIVEKRLKEDLHQKISIDTDTAKKAESINASLDSSFDADDTIDANIMLIYGDMYANVKCMLAVKFTSKVETPNEVISKNEYYPRILIVTASCIGNGLDSNEIYNIVHIGFPASLVDDVQEMGRCGQNRHYLIPDETQYTFTVLVNLHDFIYLNW